MSKPPLGSRQRLLNAGVKLFAHRGYAGTSVQDIIQKADVSKPTLYYYFQSKEGLFQALIDQAMSERLRLMQEAAPPEKETVDQLCDIILVLSEYARENPNLMRLSFAVAFQARGELPESLKCHALMRKWFEFIHSLMELGVQRGVLTDAFNLEELTKAYFHLTQHAMVIATLHAAPPHHFPEPPGHLRHQDPRRMVELFLQGAARSSGETSKTSNARHRFFRSTVLAAFASLLPLSLSAQTNSAPTTVSPAPAATEHAVAEPNAHPSTESNSNSAAFPHLVTNDAPMTTPPTASDVRPVPDTVREFASKLALVSPISENAHDPQALDLATCFRLTAQRDDQLKISLQDILIAQAQLSQTIAGFWPSFSINNQQDFIHYKEPNSSGTSTGGSFTEFSTGPTQRYYESSTHFTMNYTIFNGGQNWNTFAANSAAIAADEHNLERNYQTIYQSVAQTFYDILQYQGDIVIQEDEAQALEATVGELKQRVYLGRSRPAELLQAESNLASTKNTIEQFKGSYNAALETMAYYLGLPDKQIRLKETEKLPNAAQLQIYLEHTGARPDVLADVESLREARRNLDVASGKLLPTITASGDYLATEDPPTDQIDATITLEVSLPIFDGGLIINEIKQNKETVRQSELNLEDLQRTADENTRTAYANFNASVAQVLVLREAALLSAQNFEAQLKDYRRGVVSNLDVLTALTDFHTARQQLHDADMAARANLINLHVAAGLAATSPNVDNRALPVTSVGITPAP